MHGPLNVKFISLCAFPLHTHALLISLANWDTCSSNVRKCRKCFVSAGHPWALSFLRQDFSLQTDRQGKECI